MSSTVGKSISVVHQWGWAAAVATLGPILLCAGVQDRTSSHWRERSTVGTHLKCCFAVAFAPDGRMLATVGGDSSGELKLWDVDTGAEVASLEPHAHRVMAVAFSPDGKTLATGDGVWDGPGEVKLWDVATRKQQLTFPVQSAGVLSLAFSPDGQTLAVGSGCFNDGRYSGAVTYWNLPTGQDWGNPLQGRLGEVPSLAFSGDGSTLVTSTGYFDLQSGKNVWELKLWEAGTGKERSVLYTTRPEFRPWHVAFSPDGKLIAAGGQNSEGGVVRLWDIGKGGSTNLSGHKGMVWAVAFAPDGKTLATGDATDGVVRLWDPQHGKQQATLTAFRGAIFSMAFSPDGKHLVAAGSDGAIGLVKWWDRHDGD